MIVTCGIDWASDHHDVALADHEGTRARITDDLDGLHQLRESSAPTATLRTPRSPSRSRLSVAFSSPASVPPAGLSTPSPRWLPPVTATATPSPARKPVTSTRWCSRTSCARTRPLTALCPTTANSPWPSPSWPAPQDAVWDRTQAGNKLRSHLREYFPGFLAAFQRNREGISSSVARTVLAAAPTPEQAAKLTRTQLRSLLKKAGRQRGIETEAERLRDALRTPHMHPSPQVEQAMGLRQPDRLTGSPGPLRQATSRRRSPYRRPAQPHQPHARMPPPLPHQGHCL